MIYYDHIDHELIVIRIGRINEIVEQWEWLWWRRNELYGNVDVDDYLLN